jgi:hypothetical protein
VDGDNVFVNDGGGSSRFAAEPLPGGAAAGQMRCEDFDGDRTVEVGIKALEDDAHAAGTDQPFDFVASQPAEHFGMRRGRE